MELKFSQGERDNQQINMKINKISKISIKKKKNKEEKEDKKHQETLSYGKVVRGDFLGW